MIKLDDIVLSDSMIWQERYTSQSVDQTMVRTDGGAPVIFAAALHKGESITLVANDLYGWIQRSTVQQLLALAAVVGAQSILEHNGVLIPVMFRHQDAPAVDFFPVRPRQADEATDWMRGSIKLITV